MPQSSAVTSLRDPKRPIIAIAATGAVTKVNGPARRILGDDDSQRSGTELGALIAAFFSSHRRSSPVATLSLPSAVDEPDNADLTIVLTDDAPQAVAGTETPSSAHHAIEEGDRRLADFIAHELRNPIGAIQGIARVLRVRNEAISEADRSAALHSVEVDAQRALLILEGLLNLARARRHAGEEATPQVPVHGILRKVVTDHRSRNPSRPIALSGDSPIYARADAMGVELALGNLLNNAEKYASRNTEIEVSSHQEGNRVTIVVANEGVSLPQDRYQKLWEVYSKGPDPDVVITGSGIGLALCKELIEVMGGRVWAGPRKGGGSSFAITLPGSAETAPRPFESPRFDPEAPYTSPTRSDWSANVA